MKKHVEYLRSLNACPSAVGYADKFDTLEEAWNACERGDWMLWLVGKLTGGEVGSDSRKKLVGVSCKCARLALPYVSEGETRPLMAIETCEAYTRGEATIDQVVSAARAANDAASDAYAAARAAADASYAATVAVLAYGAAVFAAAAYAAAYGADAAAAYAAAYASDAAAYATDAAAYGPVYANRLKTLRTCSKIIRAEYSFAELGVSL